MRQRLRALTVAVGATVLWTILSVAGALADNGGGPWPK